jgi:hypothetical protein
MRSRGIRRTDMKVYRLIGWTAKIDWASTSRQIHIGIYASMEGAKAEIQRRKEGRDWTMDWDSFDIIEEWVMGDTPDSGWRKGDVDRMGGSFSDDEIIREFREKW